jgi:AhpD family alkylhydroperoxidase
METRINFQKPTSKAIQALMRVEFYLKESSIDQKTQGLIKLRASQINGCAYCVNMHYGELKKLDVPDTHLNLVSAWREAPCFTDKERAVLAWTESVTLIAQTHVPDSDYENVRKHFSEDELVDLTVAIGQINLWNRLAVSFRSIPEV